MRLLVKYFPKGLRARNCIAIVIPLLHLWDVSNSPKLIKNYNRDVAAYSRGSMGFIAIETSKLPLCTQLIEFPSNPTHAINALIT